MISKSFANHRMVFSVLIQYCRAWSILIIGFSYQGMTQSQEPVKPVKVEKYSKMTVYQFLFSREDLLPVSSSLCVVCCVFSCVRLPSDYCFRLVSFPFIFVFAYLIK